MDPALATALDRVLRPLVRLMVRRGVTFPVVARRLKRLFVEVADAEATTDSRVSVLTGLQRRDIAALRQEPATPERPAPVPLARLLATWARDLPDTLPRRGPGSFDDLARAIRKDVHPKTLLEALTQAGAAADEGDTVRRLRDVWLPPADPDALAYFGANLGDHAAAAAANLQAPRHFEQAAHADGLGPEALADLDTLVRARAAPLLKEILEAARARRTEAPGRMRFGAYLYTTEDDT